MRKTTRKLAAVAELLCASAVLLGSPTAIAQIYKCEANGAVVYQQVPCESGGKQINTSPNTMDGSSPGQRAPSSRTRPQPLPPSFAPPPQVLPGNVSSEARAAGWITVVPAPPNASDFSPRTRDLIEFVRTKRPPAEFQNGLLVNPPGIFFLWPVDPITKDALALIETEPGKFAPTALQAAICRPGFQVQGKVQVVRFSAEPGMPLPVFLAPDASALSYFEVSLDLGTYPVLLQIVSNGSVAVRVTTSSQTRLAGVQLSSYYPSVVLGVPQNLVATRYQAGLGLPKCEGSGIFAKEVAGIVPHRVESPQRVAVGEPQTPRLLAPHLGQFVDYDAPVASSYGMAVLEHLGYVRRLPTANGLPGRKHFEVLKPFRMPEGLAGAHSVNFIVRAGGPLPSGNPGHSTIWQRNPNTERGESAQR